MPGDWPKAFSHQLIHYREQRKFLAEKYFELKINKLADYFSEHGIEACVIGVSGGIDSAVTLCMLKGVLERTGSPLKRLIPALLPMSAQSCGVTHQIEAVDKARLIVNRLNLQPYEIDLSLAHQHMHQLVAESLGIEATAWSAGQLASNIRTPALYHIATLQTQIGLKAVVCGTTNRDEGGYLGYFGKASDAMVDIQPISDIHKSEVYALARYCDIPDAIIQRAPTGDTYDGLTDEEIIGCSYDEIELYTAYLNGKVDKAILEAVPRFIEVSEKLKARHELNRHKYLVGSPAVHLDVYEKAVNGGWRD